MNRKTELARASETQQSASPQADLAADADYLKNSQGYDGQISDEETAYLQSLLEDLEFLQHKESKPNAEASQEQSQKVMQKLKTAPTNVARPAQDLLLGILGPCRLKGHIVHFFNTRFDIEKHIRTVSELTDARFVEAYNYLRQNPSVEAVFVYDNRMAAAYRLNGVVRFRPV